MSISQHTWKIIELYRQDCNKKSLIYNNTLKVNMDSLSNELFHSVNLYWIEKINLKEKYSIVESCFEVLFLNIKEKRENVFELKNALDILDGTSIQQWDKYKIEIFWRLANTLYDYGEVSSRFSDTDGFVENLSV
jgi:hypothetical protein